MASTDTGKVKRNVRSEYEKRERAVYALCVYYAGVVLRHFRIHQEMGTYWINQTNIAKDTVFSQAFKEEGGQVLGFFLAHAIQYGVYLELANDRQNEALRPIINEYMPQFKARLEKLYA